MAACTMPCSRVHRGRSTDPGHDTFYQKYGEPGTLEVFKYYQDVCKAIWAGVFAALVAFAASGAAKEKKPKEVKIVEPDWTAKHAAGSQSPPEGQATQTAKPTPEPSPKGAT